MNWSRNVAAENEMELILMDYIRGEVDHMVAGDLTEN